MDRRRRRTAPGRRGGRRAADVRPLVRDGAAARPARRRRGRGDRRSQSGVECERCRTRHRAARPVAPDDGVYVDVRPWVVTAYPIEVTDVPDDVHPAREQGRPRRPRRALLEVRVRRRTDGLAVADDAAPRARPALHHRRRLAGRRSPVRRRAGDHDADASLRCARPAHGAPGPSRCGVVVGARRPRAVDRQRARPGRHRGARRDRTRWTSRPICDDDTYVAVELVPRRRFRGQGRLRDLYGRWQPLRPRAPIWFREPGDPPAHDAD